MPPYSPSKEREQRSFIRVGDRIFVASPDREDIPHQRLAEEDQIAEQVQILKKSGSIEVDAGFFTVEQWVPDIGGESARMGLPVSSVSQEARKKTAVIFQSKSPEHAVIFEYPGETKKRKFSSKVPKR